MAHFVRQRRLQLQPSIALLAVFALGLSGCTAGTPTPAPDLPAASDSGVDVDVDVGADVERDSSFQLMLLWHQHQPFYPKDDEGVVTRPWVRVHATKDYVDMATVLEQYPDVHATFNLTPVLMLQLEELQAGVRDSYWVHSEIPADDLAADEKRFILTRLFDVNARVIDRFPRYRELADRRTEAGGGEANLGVFTIAEYRDLQVLFNLAWTDPDFLAVEPLAALVAKGRDFTEEDKGVLLAEHERIVGEVFEVHRRMWDAGQIEVITTPLAHPILPLVIDTSVALVGDPTAVMPGARLNEPADAVEQVERGLDVAERLLGRRPVGMWPGEGAVSQLAAAVMSGAGVQWIATGEPVLAASLGLGSGFARGEDGVPDDAELLYRPWSATFGRNPDLPIFFRDLRLSDLVGFEYSGMTGEDAAQDFMDRLAAIKEALGPADPDHPWVVSVVLDGENAWEHYDNDGKDFFHALYSKLSAADWMTTTTPSVYLAANEPPQSLPGDVFPSSWFQANYATWIGEDEEATAWDYLIEARNDLTAAGQTGAYTDEQLAAAHEAILFAEGSDWFWWYGSDQSSGDDGYFDTAFRAWLARMYRALGREVPGYVDVPIIPSAPSEPSATSSEVITPIIDGTQSEGEWAAATIYGFTDAAPSLIALGFDPGSLHLLIDGFESSLTIELGVPSGAAKRGRTLDGIPVGFGVTHQLQLSDEQACLRPATEDGSADLTCYPAAWNAGLWEASIPVGDLGSLEAGDRVLFRIVGPDGLLPEFAPGYVQVPDISTVDVRFEALDPTGDDTGPGAYTYAKDAVFGPGSYDLTRFTAGIDGEDVVFTVEVNAPIRNPWGSAVGLSIQTFDIYIDTDPGTGTGARLFIPGRNAALGASDGWEYAVTVEGWDPSIYIAAADGTVEETKPTFKTVVLGDKGKVLIRIPAELLGGGDPAEWGYVVALLGQEGYPSGGVRRVRDVNPVAEQWRFGGAPEGTTNHTRIMDLVWPEEGGVQGGIGAQAGFLSGFGHLDISTDDLDADDVALVPLLVAGGE